MSVLPFAPGLLPGMAPGGAGPSGTAPGGPSVGGSGAVADAAAEPGGTTAEGAAFPDPGTEFAAALTAALLGAAAPTPTPTPITSTPAGAPVPDEPAGLAGRTGTVGATNRQGWLPEPSIGGAGATVADGEPAGAVPPSSGGTAQPASMATPADGTTLLRDAAGASPHAAPGAPRSQGAPSTALATDGATTLAPAAAERPGSAGSDDQVRPFDAPTVPVRHANPDGSSGAIAPAAGAAGAASAVVSSGALGGGVARAEQHPVVQQVLPAVMQLATKGNGTHRIAVTLQPEHLGEVRVTMLVRDGEVRVSLAADGQSMAKDVLLQGAPELRRLLEAAGATDTRVVVRDLPSGATTTSTSTPTDRGFGDRAPGDPDRRQPGDQPREGRGAVPTPTIQRAAPASSPTATPTTGRLDRTV